MGGRSALRLGRYLQCMGYIQKDGVQILRRKEMQSGSPGDRRERTSIILLGLNWGEGESPRCCESDSLSESERKKMVLSNGCEGIPRTTGAC